MSIAEQIILAKADYNAVYAKGIEIGKSQGGDTEEAFERGKAAAEDAFWDGFQANGNRIGYLYAFTEQSNYEYWSKGFTPKYPLDFSNTAYYADGTFIYFGAKSKKPIDFAEFIAKNNIQLKLTTYDGYKNCMVVGKQTFYNSYFSHLPRLYASQLNETFRSCSELVTIDYIHFSGTTNSHNSPFIGCSKLENVTFGGQNKSTGLSFSNCSKLTVDSMLSLFDCLYDFSGSTAKSVTLGSTNLAKLTDEQKAIAIAKNWTLA